MFIGRIVHETPNKSWKYRVEYFSWTMHAQVETLSLLIIVMATNIHLVWSDYEQLLINIY